MWYALLKTMRPKQWVKNVFVFAALVFDEKLFRPPYVVKAGIAFVLFCLISSAVYLINDIADIEKDRQHPSKRQRPLASGQLSPRTATVAAGVLVVVSAGGAFWLSPWVGAVILGYFLMQVAYSFGLKNLVIVDVLTIAAGFLLRVQAGVIVAEVERFSPWLYICMTLLALFLGIGKRRGEIILLAENAENHRRVLDEYNIRFLDEMIAMVTSSTVMAYSLYTFSAPNLPANHAMMLTIPFVLYGLFRYLYLIHVRGAIEPPDQLVLKDRPLLLNFILWGLAVVVVLYLF
ncbi:MAG: decaprenyl-phosphate phosphoribosyltransferase [Anaerolineae bacterium]